MAVITISRQFGAGGRTLGQKLAERLKYTFADNNIIQMLAREANVSINWVEAFEKEAGSRLSKLISGIVSQKWIDRVLGGEYGYLDEQIYLDYLVLIIARMADEGNVVILGRGSQYILDDHPEAIHVLMVDSLENRIQFMMRHYGLGRNKAEKVVHSEDRRRANLYRRLGKTGYEDPSLYHLVLNMGRLDLEAAVDLVAGLVA
jgi:cytidylate kinase